MSATASESLVPSPNPWKSGSITVLASLQFFLLSPSYKGGVYPGSETLDENPIILSFQIAK